MLIARTIVILAVVVSGSLSSVALADVRIKGTETGTRNAQCWNDAFVYEMSADAFIRLTNTTEEVRSLYRECPVTISFEGDVSNASVKTLISLLSALFHQAKNKSLVVLTLNSEGGDIRAALHFGDVIRTLEIKNVKFTVLEDSRCYSACVILLAAGYLRRVEGKVGIHRPYFTESVVIGLEYRSMKKAYDGFRTKMQDFLNRVNINAELSRDMWQIPSHEIKKLTKRELEKYGLSRDDAVLTKLHKEGKRGQSELPPVP